jgi:hypothetical protein
LQEESSSPQLKVLVLVLLLVGREMAMLQGVVQLYCQ